MPLQVTRALLLLFLACCLALPLPRASAAAEGDQPPWLPQALAIAGAKMPADTPALDTRVLAGEEGQLFLAIIWKRGLHDEFEERFELHRVTLQPQNGVTLTLLREMETAFITMAQPAGGEVFPGEAPIIALATSGGGMGWFNSGLLLLQLSGDGVDITPRTAGQLLDLTDLDGDGRFELIARDFRWGNFFHGCSACGPLIPIVLERRDGEFHPACRRYPALYADLFSALETPGTQPGWHDQEFAAAALASAQLGMTAQAETYYQELERWLREVAPGLDSGVTETPPQERLDAVRQSILPLLAEAATWTAVACPLSASGEASPPSDDGDDLMPGVGLDTTSFQVPMD